jgi:hypothetical protein
MMIIVTVIEINDVANKAVIIEIVHLLPPR